jgi:hypothetical protein
VIPSRFIVRAVDALFQPGIDADVQIEVDADESLDVTAAALEAEDPVLERSRLVSRQFTHGRHRRWVVDHHGMATVVSLTIHEFSSAEQAAFSLADLREQFRAAAIGDLRVDRECLHCVYLDDEPGFAFACASQATGLHHVLVVVRFPRAQTGDEAGRLMARTVCAEQIALLAGINL